MNLPDFFRQRASSGRPMVLVTVFETHGSTYSKAGGQMIIDSEGKFCGMLSGGCLEGDLAERARRIIETGRPETARYDLSADDELWGLGVGCDGTMQILLQPLTPENAYQPFAAVTDVLDRQASADLVVVISADSAEIEAGAALVFQNSTRLSFGINSAAAESIEHALDRLGNEVVTPVDTTDGRCIVLRKRIAPSPALLVLGAGLDAEPVVRIAAELGWRSTVSDHRPAYIQSRAFPEGTRTLCCPAGELEEQLALDGFDMSIVMSHHLASDRSYLRQLAGSSIGYVGLLGPAGRRQRLMSELEDQSVALEGRLHGPAGIDLGGRGPGPIALSIVAEMQRFLSDRRQVGGGVDIEGRRLESNSL